MHPLSKKNPLSNKKVQTSALTAVGALIVASAVSLGAHSAGAFTAEVYRAPASGSWIVDGRGNGHGHGMSQYGARGAAIAGLSATQILAFYYPGTTLTTLAAPAIRVWITDQGAYTTVGAQAGLSVTGVGALPTTGISRWRLIPSGSGLALQRLTTTWATRKAGLPSTATFSSTTGVVRMFHGGGDSTVYRGSISAVRSGSGEITVNRLGLDDYVRGVIPNEMSSSWQAAAVRAQAVAARTYARYDIEHSGGAYDICDTTNCQVYRGKSSEASGSDAAVVATANKVLTYQGHAAFAQFSASDGGVMAAGGQPYLVAKPDPYDNAASGDPYLSMTRTVSVAYIASYYGLARATEIDITGRAGGGTWGGIVTTAVVRGTNSAGAARAVSTTGNSLANAFDLSYSLFRLRAAALPIGHVDSIAMETPTSYRITGWTFDPQHSERVDAGARVRRCRGTVVPGQPPAHGRQDRLRDGERGARLLGRRAVPRNGRAQALCLRHGRGVSSPHDDSVQQPVGAVDTRRPCRIGRTGRVVISRQRLGVRPEPLRWTRARSRVRRPRRASVRRSAHPH